MVDKLVGLGVVIEILEIYFEERDFSLGLSEDHLVVAVLLSLCEDSGEEEFI